MKKLINFLAKLGGLIAFGTAVYGVAKEIKEVLDGKRVDDYLRELMDDFEDDFEDDDKYDDNCECCNCDCCEDEDEQLEGGIPIKEEDVVLEKIDSEATVEEQFDAVNADVTDINNVDIAKEIAQADEEIEAAKQGVTSKSFKFTKHKKNKKHR